MSKFISMRSPVAFQVSWTSISHWQIRLFAILAMMATPPLRLENDGLPLGKHNQGTLLFFSILTGYLMACSWFSRSIGNAPHMRIHPLKIRLVKSSFFAIKINCFGLAVAIYKPDPTKSVRGYSRCSSLPDLEYCPYDGAGHSHLNTE